MSDYLWNPDSTALLVETTRELKFDWNAIAKKMATETGVGSLTPAMCRQQYAKEYSKNTKEDSHVATNESSIPSSVEPSKAEIWQNFDKMSLEDLIDHVNKKEQEMNSRKEAIFQRVLNSLGNSEDADSHLSDAMAAEIEEVKKKYFDSVQQKEIEKLNKQQLAYDQQEKINIEKEREKLKKRFDADSVDNIGENPLGDLDTTSAVSASSASALSASDSAALAQLLGNREVSGSAADKQLFASLIKSSETSKSGEASEPVAEVSTDLESILAGEQFDVLLSEIEKELDSQSQDKVEDEPSELFEVLSMLENAAKQKKQASSAAKAKASTTSAANAAANVASSAEYLSVFGPKPTPAVTTGVGNNSKTGAKDSKTSAPSQSSSRRMKPVDEQSDSDSDDLEDSSRGSSRQTSPVKPPDLRASSIAATPAKSTSVEENESDDDNDSEEEEEVKKPLSPVQQAVSPVTETQQPTRPLPTPVVSVSADTAAKTVPSVVNQEPEVVAVPVASEPIVEVEDPSPSAVGPSQVTGSLAGSAAGSSRRVKGKLGSIMSNSAPRGSGVAAKPPTVIAAPVVGPPVQAIDDTADVKYVESPKTFIKVSVPAPAHVKTVVEAPSTVAVETAKTSETTEPVDVVSPPLTHCTLEPIVGAPALATLNVTDKTGSAGVYQIVIAQSKLSNEFNSDVPLALVLQWIFKILRGNEHYRPMKICGLQSGSSVTLTEGSAPHSAGCKCIVTIEDSLSEEGGFSVADFNYLCSITSLSSVGVEVCSVDLRMLKEFVTVSVVSDVSSLASKQSNLNNAIVSESLHPTPGVFLSDDNIVVTCMKDYVLEEYGLLNFITDAPVLKDGLLYHYFSSAEVGGLRLAGMRLVYLEQKYIDFGNYKMFISQPVQSFVNTSYDGPRPPLVGVWCFAFYSGVASLHTRDIANKASAGLQAVNRSVADTLRTIHGPDDCILAARTDPQSMRARFGCKSANSRVRNIFYNIPFAADKIKAELRFWFGTRTSPTMSTEPSLSLLNYNASKRLLVGVSLEEIFNLAAGDDTFVFSNNKVLSELQHAVYFCVSDALNNSVNKFTSLQVLAKPAFRVHFPTANANQALCLLVEYESSSSMEYLSKMEGVLNQAVQQATATVLSNNRSSVRCSEWRSDVFLTLSESKGVVTQQTGSQLALLEVLKVVPESHYRSHEDVGLSDVCLVTLHAKDSNQLTATQSVDSLVVALTKLIRHFPTTCRVTLIACKTNTNPGSDNPTVQACLRGYQLLENIDHSISSVSDSSAVHVRAAKGKRCLSELLLEFNIANVYVEGALRDQSMYVPEGAALPTGSNPACEVALALYPPGHFVNTAVLLHPIAEVSSSSAAPVTNANSNVNLTRNLARVINKLEKENFEVLDILVTSDGAISSGLLSDLESDNYSEYAYAPIANGVKVAAVKNYVAVVVRKNAALFKLKSLLGPMFSDDFALTSYPHSIAAHFAGGAPAAGTVVLFPTLNISSVRRALSEVFVGENKTLSRSMNDLYTQISSLQSLNNIHHGTESDTEHSEESVDTLTVAARSAAYFGSRSFHCSSSRSLTTSPTASSVLAKSSDIAAIVVTHRLIQQNGLGTILEALHREGLSIVNIYVSTVSPSQAKILLDLTGASSLSLKPSTAHLTQGPAVFLGLEGPSHALIRLKSFGVAAKSTHCLWALDGTANEWGIVASSSSRLAKDLYAYCFDRIFCSNSVFTLNSEASADGQSKSESV